MFRFFLSLIFGISILFTAQPILAESQTIPEFARPLSGHHFGWYQFNTTGLDHNSIVYNYHKPEVKQLVQQNLTSMRQQGVGIIRLIVWFMHDKSDHNWGVTSSKGPSLDPLFASNITAYFSDIKAAGFPALFVAFDPMWTNGPTHTDFKIESVQENFSFIQKVRQIAKEHGPDTIYFDLSNEIGPQEGIKNWNNGNQIFQNMMSYISQLWTLYYDHYGNEDASIGFIANSEPGVPDSLSLHNLLNALKNSQRPFPKWFPTSLYTPSQESAYRRLLYIQAKLTEFNLDQSKLIVAESFYNDPATHQGIKQFLVEQPSLPIIAILDWPLDQGVDPTNIAGGVTRGPPFTSTAFFQTFPPFVASLSCQPSFNSLITNQLGSAIIDLSIQNFFQKPQPLSLCVQQDQSAKQLMGLYSQTMTQDIREIDWIKGGSSYIFSLHPSSDCMQNQLTSCNITTTNIMLPGDLNNDGKVDIFDYQRLISNFGNPYTIFDYQKVISNFVR